MRGLAIAAACLLAPCVGAQALPTPDDAFPGVARAYWVEIDGRPTWAGASTERLPMASLTKLMTALLLSEGADLEAMVTVGAGTVSETGSRIGLRLGERAKARDLFVVMMVRSANDACRALADWHAGDQVRFVEAMNARARLLGLRDTRFADACGHDAPTQYSTARDLAVLARAAMARPDVAEAAQRRDYAFATQAGRRFQVRTTNALLGRFDGATGLKTGYTPGAGRCLIALAERDGVQVLAVMLDAPDRWWDTVGLLELAFDEARARRRP